MPTPGWNGVGEGRAKGSVADFSAGEEAQDDVTSKINKQTVIQKGCRCIDMIVPKHCGNEYEVNGEGLGSFLSRLCLLVFGKQLTAAHYFGVKEAKNIAN